LLLDLAEKNCREHYATKLKMLDRLDPGRRSEILLERIQQSLHLPKPPHHIECFDNSNLQGTNPVASCVVFLDGKPSKRDYRHFNIKTVEGSNDFASMQEIVYRRYRRIIDEQQPLPDLLVIDGGKGQLSAAYESLVMLELETKVPILGLAKRLEEIYVPFDPTPLYLDKNSEALRVLMQIRDEAHRFGISFHRKKRSGKFLTSELDTIVGVGEKSLLLLLKKYGSIDKIRLLTFDELSSTVQKSIAAKIHAHFHK
jgi:excinuclease ABC subunit C